MAQTREGAVKSAAKNAGITPEEYLAKIAAGLKRCSQCKEWKPVSKYNKDKMRSDGLYTKCHDCIHSQDPYASLRGRVPAFKGKKHTEESRRKMSEANMGQKKRLGKKHALESRIKMSQTVRANNARARGPAHHSYKDGKLAERRGLRFSTEYKRWRFDVFARDHFTCQDCGDARGGNLNAHHIKEWADYPELRFDANNGVTLCTDCHKTRHAAQ